MRSIRLRFPSAFSPVTVARTDEPVDTVSHSAWDVLKRSPSRLVMVQTAAITLTLSTQAPLNVCLQMLSGSVRMSIRSTVSVTYSNPIVGKKGPMAARANSTAMTNANAAIDTVVLVPPNRLALLDIADWKLAC